MDEKEESTTMDEPMDVVEDQEVLEEMKDEQNEPEDESVKEEASDDKVDDHEKDKPVPKSTRKRGGGRRKRRKPAAASKEESSKESSTKQIDETEIEVSAENSNDAQEEENDDDDGEKEPEREPSPVMTRRSNRKLQQLQKTEQKSEQVEEFESTEDDIKLENDPDIEKCEDDEESIASEMDSVASNSTITTKGSRGNRSQDSRKKVKNGKGGRAKSTNSNNGNGTASVATTSTKGKSRRIIFKKSATRAPSAIARAVTSDRIYYKGQYFTKGDIVSVEDMDGSVYYAQLRGFLTDQYCEKSGVITWLLPTVNSPPPEDSFDPSTYVIGPEEDLPRKLDYFTFVMHAPDDYFYYRNAPYPTTAIETDQEYLITRQGPKVRVIKAGQPVYQESIPPLIPLPASVGGSS